jgi:hypothetical protein
MRKYLTNILRRNCLLKHIIEGEVEGGVEVTGRKGRRRKQLLDDLKETRGYWKLKEETLESSAWRTLIGRGCEPVIRRTTERMIIIIQYFSMLQSPCSVSAYSG